VVSRYLSLEVLEPVRGRVACSLKPQYRAVPGSFQPLNVLPHAESEGEHEPAPGILRRLFCLAGYPVILREDLRSRQLSRIMTNRPLRCAI